MLRPYQSDNKTAIYRDWQTGVRNVLYVLPTGGGKSVVVSDIVKDKNNDGMRSLVMAHRTELVGQMSLHVAREGIRHQIIGPASTVAQVTAEHRRELGRSFIDPSSRCAVAGVDTINARKDELSPWLAQVGFWTVDEAHHLLVENKWGAAVALMPNAFGLGVTASPRRADGKGLGLHVDGVFGSMVIGPTMRELIGMGALTDYEIALPSSDFDVASLTVTDSGDYSPKAMREASKNSHIVGDVVLEYIKYAWGKRGVAFVTDVETAHEMADRFNAFGIPTVAVSAKTKAEVRAEYIRRFRNGDIWVMVNVDLFGEGFDLPAIEVVMMARPTASLAVYLQQFGRGLRLLAGKTRGLVIDHVSNFKRHGAPDKPHLWSLDARERKMRKSDPDELKQSCCTNCTRPKPRTSRICPYCLYDPVPTGGGRSVEQVDGDLLLLTADILAQMRVAIELEAPASVASRTMAVAGANAAAHAMASQRDRIAEQSSLSDIIDLWAGRERARGRDDPQSYRRFYLATGGVDVLSALALSRADMEKLRHQIEEWLK